MRRTLIMLTALACLALASAAPAGASEHGFEQYGYNEAARLFVGTCQSWGEAEPGWTAETAKNYCGIYDKDRLVMKWNAAWDECNAHGYDDAIYCAGAMLTNEWNGKVAGGSGESSHDKIIWVGSEGEESPYWREGGVLIWGNYEDIMEQGTTGSVHWWATHAIPNGFGAGA